MCYHVAREESLWMLNSRIDHTESAENRRSHWCSGFRAVCAAAICGWCAITASAQTGFRPAVTVPPQRVQPSASNGNFQPVQYARPSFRSAQSRNFQAVPRHQQAFRFSANAHQSSESAAQRYVRRRTQQPVEIGTSADAVRQSAQRSTPAQGTRQLYYRTYGDMRETVQPIQHVQPQTGPLPQQILAMPVVQETMNVIHHHSQLMISRARIVRTAIADDSVIDIAQFSPNEISIIGMSQGTTTLTIWFENTPQPLIYLVKTIADPSVEEQHHRDCDGADAVKRGLILEVCLRFRFRCCFCLLRFRCLFFIFTLCHFITLLVG
ncbi:MAG: pilus assembly protein N-terminal domain-containing protein [Planctomycetes bacterium]|nr:pilus assembly protein N-terminal domain-containing protein [Planctomycetota bacterium]